MPQNEPFVPLSYGDAPVSGLRVKEVFCGTDAECDDFLPSQNRDVLAY